MKKILFILIAVLLVTNCDFEIDKKDACKQCIKYGHKYLIKYDYKIVGCYRYDISKTSTHLVLKAYRMDGRLLIEDHVDTETEMSIIGVDTFCEKFREEK